MDLKEFIVLSSDEDDGKPSIPIRKKRKYDEMKGFSNKPKSETEPNVTISKVASNKPKMELKPNVTISKVISNKPKTEPKPCVTISKVISNKPKSEAKPITISEVISLDDSEKSINVDSNTEDNILTQELITDFLTNEMGNIGISQEDDTEKFENNVQPRIDEFFKKLEITKSPVLKNPRKSQYKKEKNTQSGFLAQSTPQKLIANVVRKLQDEPSCSSGPNPRKILSDARNTNPETTGVPQSSATKKIKKKVETLNITSSIESFAEEGKILVIKKKVFRKNNNPLDIVVIETDSEYFINVHEKIEQKPSTPKKTVDQIKSSANFSENVEQKTPSAKSSLVLSQFVIKSPRSVEQKTPTTKSTAFQSNSNIQSAGNVEPTSKSIVDFEKKDQNVEQTSTTKQSESAQNVNQKKFIKQFFIKTDSFAKMAKKDEQIKPTTKATLVPYEFFLKSPKNNVEQTASKSTVDQTKSISQFLENKPKPPKRKTTVAQIKSALENLKKKNAELTATTPKSTDQTKSISQFSENEPKQPTTKSTVIQSKSSKESTEKKNFKQKATTSKSTIDSTKLISQFSENEPKTPTTKLIVDQIKSLTKLSGNVELNTPTKSIIDQNKSLQNLTENVEQETATIKSTIRSKSTKKKQQKIITSKQTVDQTEFITKFSENFEQNSTKSTLLQSNFIIQSSENDELKTTTTKSNQIESFVKIAESVEQKTTATKPIVDKTFIKIAESVEQKATATKSIVDQTFIKIAESVEQKATATKPIVNQSGSSIKIAESVEPKATATKSILNQSESFKKIADNFELLKIATNKQPILLQNNDIIEPATNIEQKTTIKQTKSAIKIAEIVEQKTSATKSIVDPSESIIKLAENFEVTPTTSKSIIKFAENIEQETITTKSSVNPSESNIKIAQTSETVNQNLGDGESSNKNEEPTEIFKALLFIRQQERIRKNRSKALRLRRKAKRARRLRRRVKFTTRTKPKQIPEKNFPKMDESKLNEVTTLVSLMSVNDPMSLSTKSSNQKFLAIMIDDFLTAKRKSTFPFMYEHNNIEFKHVNIVGTIVGIYTNVTEKIQLIIEDTTGRVTCVVEHKEYNKRRIVNRRVEKWENMLKKWKKIQNPAHTPLLDKKDLIRIMNTSDGEFLEKFKVDKKIGVDLLQTYGYHLLRKAKPLLIDDFPTKNKLSLNENSFGRHVSITGKVYDWTEERVIYAWNVKYITLDALFTRINELLLQKNNSSLKKI